MASTAPAMSDRRQRFQQRGETHDEGSGIEGEQGESR